MKSLNEIKQQYGQKEKSQIVSKTNVVSELEALIINQEKHLMDEVALQEKKLRDILSNVKKQKNRLNEKMDIERTLLAQISRINK